MVFPEKADCTRPKSRRKESEEQPVPPDPESPSNLLNALNDDCLLEIFRYLSLKDLGSVADVCEKFKAIADTIFPSKYSCATWDISGAHRLERLLRNFRTDIKSLSILGGPSSKVCYGHAILMNLIHYFMDPGCQFHRFSIKEFRSINVKPWKHLLSPIFDLLHYLHVENCDYYQFVRYCRNLKELEMIKSGPTYKITAHEFRQIKDVLRNLEKFSSDDNRGFIQDVMKVNTMLKSLELLTPDGETYIDTILSKFPN